MYELNIKFQLLYDYYMNWKNYNKALKLFEVMIEDVERIKGFGYVRNLEYLCNLKIELERKLETEENV